jgi:phosphoenolpyruvate carboxylase
LRSHARAGTFERVERLRVLSRGRRAGSRDADDAEVDAVLDGTSVDDAGDVIRAFNLYFQMVNLAEQLHRERRRRERAMRGEAPLRGSIDTLSADAARAVPQLEIRLVFTAHPTEVLRRTISEKLAEIAASLRALDERVLTPEERAALEAELHAQIVLLWQTNELYATPPTVQDEVRNLVARFRESLFDETLALYERLEARAGVPVPAFLTYGSWIGGDRDGNANVAPDAVLDAHEQGRRFVLERYVAAVEALQVRLSVDASRGAVDAAVVDSIGRDAADLPDVRYVIGPRQEAEPYRRKLAFVHRRLRLTAAGAPGGYAAPAALLDDLRPLCASVAAHSGEDVAGPVRRLIRAVDVFGFRLYALEWRQHRDRVAAALAGDEGAEDVAASLRAVAHLRASRGADAVASLILAGTESASDVLALFELARLCGALDAGPIAVVPLLESTSALGAAAEIVAALLEHPRFRRHVAAAGDVLEVMLGYSDTTKVAGVVASWWELYRAQVAIAAAVSRYGVAVRFFHGRGGSTGRGAADALDAVASQPPQARSARYKVTEQGEVIGARYGLPSLARRNLEMTVTAVVDGLAPWGEPDPAWIPVLDRFAGAARDAYASLVRDPAFLAFFAACTPLDEIGDMQISSRPGRRGGRRSIEDLRAIPWSFGWTQTRAMLPGWYGFGTAVGAMRDALPSLRAIARGFPAFAVLLRSIERALAVADLDIFARYARELVSDEPLRARFTEQIAREYAGSVDGLLDVLGESSLLAHDATLARSIDLRNPYVDPVSLLQVRLLRAYRGERAGDPLVRDAIRLSINGIAAGLRVTG